MVEEGPVVSASTVKITQTERLDLRRAIWQVCDAVSAPLRRSGGLGVQGRPLLRGAEIGLDFEGYDDYRIGADVRRVDWSLYGRTRALHVRRFQDEGSGCLALLVDASGSMGVGRGAKWKRAYALAAVLALTGLRELHQVKIGVVRNGKTQWLPTAVGFDSAEQILRFLEAHRPFGSTRLGPAMDTLPESDGVRGLCILLSDFLDPAGGEGSIARVRRRGWGMGLVRISDPNEFDFSAERLSNPEGDGVASLPNDGTIAAEIASEIQAHRAALIKEANRYRIGLADLSTEETLRESVLRVLGKVFLHRVDRSQVQ